MSRKTSRRDFVLTSAAAGLALTAPRTSTARGPAVITQKGPKPIVISSAKEGRREVEERAAEPRTALAQPT